MKNLYFFQSKNGMLNLEVNGVTYYSRYDPEKDVEKFLKKQISDKKNRYIIFGLGLGYHVKKLLELDSKPIVIVEPDEYLKNKIQSKIDLSSILNNKRVTFIQDLQLLSLSSDDQLIILPPWQKTLDEGPLKEKFQEILINRNSIKANNRLIENFKENHLSTINNMMLLNDFLHGETAILVSAGPSLDYQINFLKNVKGSFFILAVGSAYKPLLAYNIIPDAVIISDPNPSVYEQVSNLVLDIPLFFASTVYPEIATCKAPLKVILYQNGMTLAEEFANENKIMTLKTGGSVAHLGFSLLLFMGISRLIFIGQDLAYKDGKSHSSLSTSNNSFNRIIKNNLTLSNRGEMVATSLSWNYFRKFFETEILNYPNVEFINTSLDGAVIKGIKYVESNSINTPIKIKRNYIQDIIEKYKL